MKITYNNYLEKIGSVDWSKTNDTLRRAKDEMNEFHELYNDDDTIKETFDLFLKQLNEVLAKVDVKPTEKKLPKPILKAGTLMYLNKAVLRHLRGTQVEVASDYYSDDDEVSVRCCSGERIKQRFSVDFKDLVKENPKKQSSSAKPKFKKGDYVYWLKNPEEVRYGKKAVVNYDRVDKIIGTEKDIHGTLRYKTEEVLLSGGNPRKGVAYESYLVLADLKQASKNINKKLKPQLSEILKNIKKIKLDNIKVIWSEGDVEISDKLKGKVFKSWEAANNAVKPILEDDGYNKVKFEVTFKDGDVYGGRLYVSQKEDNPEKTNNVFGQHIYNYLSSLNTKDAKDYIQRYDLGLSDKKPVAKKQSSSTKPKTKIQKPKTATKKESPCDEAIETFLENQKEARQKASKKRQKTKVADALDKESVNFYNAEFRLLRRFYNLVTKTTVVKFRAIQLLYMAFQKHSVARKVRKTSELAPLYEIANKKLTKLFNTVATEKQNANINVADKDLLEQLSKLVSNKKVDYAISLMNRVINIQGTAPEDAKVKRLISSIENAFKNGRVDERSRLHDDLVKAKKELNNYLNDKVEYIPTVNYGLSGVKKKVETNVVAANKMQEITLKGVATNSNKQQQNTSNNVANLVANVVANVGSNTQGVEIKEVNNFATEQQKSNKNVIQPVKVIPKNATTSKKMPFKTVLQNLSEQKEPVNLLRIVNPDLKKFLGNIEIKKKQSLAITLDSGEGGGKTHTAFQFAGETANNDYKTIFWSLEEHAESNLSKQKQQKYFTDYAKNNVSVVSEDNDLSKEENYKRIVNSIKHYDIIVIDSWAKVLELNSTANFDQDFRKAFNGKIFLVIFQRTSDGKMRGGAKGGFDADIVLKVEVDRADFRNNYVYNHKNRYNDYMPISDLKYSPYYQKLITEQQEESVKEITLSSSY